MLALSMRIAHFGATPHQTPHELIAFFARAKRCFRLDGMHMFKKW
jgi:hypothetical protein